MLKKNKLKNEDANTKELGEELNMIDKSKIGRAHV